MKQLDGFKHLLSPILRRAWFETFVWPELRLKGICEFETEFKRWMEGSSKQDGNYIS